MFSGHYLSEGIVDVAKANYEKDVTDEFLKPIIANSPDGRTDGDTLFFFNYRSDRVREIVTVMGLADSLMEVDIPADLGITTMSRYSTEFPFPVAFPPQSMTNVFAECLATHDIKQAHITATEKYAYVTSFFNGGVEKQFENEERHMIPSPKAAIYDKELKMSADKIAEVLKQKTHFRAPGYGGEVILLVTADHGNAEQMNNVDTGAPHTAHTANSVPFIMTGTTKFTGDAEGEKEGALCDVAPTVVLLGLPQSEEMTG
ncbi:alkaline-phosphatase-like protein [Infundibulicybe gibba]|nr:alkaline-phosphatase-like protein [Infundibulicybe gibba]